MFFFQVDIAINYIWQVVWSGQIGHFETISTSHICCSYIPPKFLPNTSKKKLWLIRNRNLERCLLYDQQLYLFLSDLDNGRQAEPKNAPYSEKRVGIKFFLRNKLSDKQSEMSTKWFAQWLIIQMKFLSAGRRLQVTKDNNDSVNLLK